MLKSLWCLSKKKHILVVPECGCPLLQILLKCNPTNLLTFYPEPTGGITLMRQLCNINITYVHLRIGVCIMTVAISQRGPTRSSHADQPRHQITSATQSLWEIQLQSITLKLTKTNLQISFSCKNVSIYIIISYKLKKSKHTWTTATHFHLPSTIHLIWFGFQIPQAALPGRLLATFILFSCRAMTQHFSDSHKYTMYFKDKKS